MPDQGRLVLVVGPSGVGKDTLIDAARALGLETCAFPRREVTRAAELGGEDYVSVSDEMFDRRQAEGGYALSWRAHGLGYGVPADIEELLAAGRTVIANVSRAVIDEARRRYPNLVVVSVTADPDILRARLQARGRETEADIEARVARAAAFQVEGEDVFELRNDGAREDAVQAFVGLLAPAS